MNSVYLPRDLTIVYRGDSRYRVEHAQPKDLRAILRLEVESQSSPWTLAVFEHELKLDVSGLWILRDETDSILGYLCFWIVVDEGHILNLVIHPNYRRLGLGSVFLSTFFASVESIPLVSVTLEVRESNLGAQKLYTNFGFQSIGRRKGYYVDNQEAAIVMSRLMEEPSC